MKSHADQIPTDPKFPHTTKPAESQMDAVGEFIQHTGKSSLIRNGEFIGFTWGHFTNFVRRKRRNPTCHLNNVDQFLNAFLDQDEVIYRTKQHLSGAE
ncbi:hypothetical protein DI392_00875 [Vibrio albus]|uniref:Uncharacterized protein n=1 Tax=Vibrio albus TaxID=2200953 RepID=A0A2U3BDJ0_9VIBR|nr:hypothetical protein [Vibrio albus]PWI34866.1 hypothetical protein DI392_00875 [Vibrio albus]